MTILPPSPFLSSAATSSDVAVEPVAASSPPAPTGDAAAGPILESSTATGGHQEAPPAETPNNRPAGGLFDQTDCIGEIFAHQRRRFEPDMDALYDKIVPPEPPPVFLRSPSQNFLRALFDLGR